MGPFPRPGNHSRSAKVVTSYEPGAMKDEEE